MLLKELQQLREGRVKETIINIIDSSIKMANIDGATYEKAVDIIVKFAKDNDYLELLAGYSDSELAGYVKDSFSKEDYAEMNESVMEEDEMEGEDTEKVIAKADEFKVIFHTATEQVDLIDGEETVRVSMPLVIWKQLTR